MNSVRKIQTRLWQLAMCAAIATLGIAELGCVGTADVAGVNESADDTAADETNAAAETTDGGDYLASLLPLLGGMQTGTAEDTDPVSRREVAARVVDLAATATGASEQEQVVWGLASAAIREGKKGLQSSLLDLLFSPLADVFASQIGGPD
jgi:hypothetical protein